MASERIPFEPMQKTSGSLVGGAAPLAMNVVFDAAKCVRRRPGIGLYSGAPSAAVATGIEALHVDFTGTLWAVSSEAPRRIYRVTGSGSVTIPGENVPGPSRYRAIVAHTEGMIVAAAGGNPVKVLYSNETVTPLGGSPPQATHILANSGRLLSNNLQFRGQVWFSGIATGGATAGHEQWTLGIGNAGFVGAEARPDPVVAVAENTNEVFVWGTTSLQVFAPDGITVYAPGSTREHGCIAPYSIIKRDQSFVWLDDRRRFVASDGRNVEPIGDDIQSQVDAMETVSDCYGFRLRTGTTDALVWVFPSEGVAFAYAGGWSQWAGYGEQGYSLLNIGAAELNPGDGVQVVGTRDGFVGELTEAVNTDLGVPIKAEIVTGFLNRGSDQRKHCKAVHISLRRGENETGSHKAWLSYRDAPGEPWKNLPISLGTVGQSDPVITFRSLGTYRRRQWKFEFAEDSNLTLASAEEQFEGGSS
jgi:hypothetical protein